MFGLSTIRKLLAGKYLCNSGNYVNKNEIEKAIHSAKMFLKLYPKKENDENHKMSAFEHECFAIAHYNLGASYAKKGDYNQGLKEYNAVLCHKENDAEAYNNIGGIYSLMNDQINAKVNFEKAIKYNENYPEPHVNLARGYYHQGDYIQAIKDFTFAIKKNNNYEIAYLERAASFIKLEQYNEAINDLYSVLRINPNNKKAIFNINQLRDKVK